MKGSFSFHGPRTIEISRNKKQLFASVARARHVCWIFARHMGRFQFQWLVCRARVRLRTHIELEAVRHCVSVHRKGLKDAFDHASWSKTVADILWGTDIYMHIYTRDRHTGHCPLPSNNTTLEL